jgi:hypothetical protein
LLSWIRTQPTKINADPDPQLDIYFPSRDWFVDKDYHEAVLGIQDVYPDPDIDPSRIQQ